MNYIKTNVNYNEYQITELLNAAKKMKFDTAGYPGEDNVGWTSATVISQNSSLIDGSTLIDHLLSLGLDIRLGRILVLKSGGRISEHTDNFLSNRILRLHIPLKTNEKVSFFIDKEKSKWSLGELWYGDFSKPHYGYNLGQTERIHLVIDININSMFYNLLTISQRSKFGEEINNDIKSQNFDKTVLKAFECKFILPNGFALPGLPFDKIAQDLEGQIRFEGSDDIQLYINEQPLLKLEPLSEDVLNIIGLEKNALLEFKFDKEKPKSINLNIENYNIPINVLS